MRLFLQSRTYQRLVIALILTVCVAGLTAPGQTQVTEAQGTGGSSCAQIMPAVQAKLKSCSEMDRDQICYGNPAITATFVDSSKSTTFNTVGDIVDLSSVKSLETAPYNQERNEWGIAALKVQVTNLDGTTTGQSATFAIFGDTTLTNATPPNTGPAPAVATPLATCTATTKRLSNLRNAPSAGAESVKTLPANSAVNVTGRLDNSTWLFGDFQGETGWVLASTVNLSCDAASRPVIDPNVPVVMSGLRAFYFTAGVSAQAQCKDLPPTGFLVRSPSGRKMQFSVNGAQISMGSTVEALLVNGKLVYAVLDGQITITVNGHTVTVSKGQQVTLNLDNGTPPQVVEPLGTPGPITVLPNEGAVLCMVNPVFDPEGLCSFKLPTNVTLLDTGGDILSPDSNPNQILGPHKPPIQGPPAPSCIPSGDPCSGPSSVCCPIIINGTPFPLSCSGGTCNSG